MAEPPSPKPDGTQARHPQHLSNQGRSMSRRKSFFRSSQSSVEVDAKPDKAATRAAKLASLDGRHRYIIDALVERFEMTQDDVETCFIELSMDTMERFFVADGIRSLSFFYIPPGKAQGESKADARDEKKVAPLLKKACRIKLADPSTDQFYGRGLVATRVTTRAVTAFNADQDIYFHGIQYMEESHSDAETGLMTYIHRNKERRDSGEMMMWMELMLEKVFFPHVVKTREWALATGDYKARRTFIDQFQQFITFLKHCRYCLSHALLFRRDDSLDFSPYANAMVAREASLNPAALATANILLKEWSQNLSIALSEMTRARCEPETADVRFEYWFWKQRCSKLSSVVHYKESPYCRGVRNVLLLARSPIFKAFKKLDGEITVAWTEAKDNCKHLFIIDQCCVQMLKEKPEKHGAKVANVVRPIRLMYQYSRSYGQLEMVEALFIKVTTMLITSCQNYISCDNRISVWNLKFPDLRARFAVIHNIFREYQRSYHAEKDDFTKQMLFERREGGRNPYKHRDFAFCEDRIFEKFLNFCNRLKKLETVLSWKDLFAPLNRSRIESIEQFTHLYNKTMRTLMFSPHKALNYHDVGFDKIADDAIVTFNKMLIDLQKFTDDTFNIKVPRVYQALQVIVRFEDLQIVELRYRQRYELILRNLGSDVGYHTPYILGEDKRLPKLYHMPRPAGAAVWRKIKIEDLNKHFKTIRVRQGGIWKDKAPWVADVGRHYNQFAISALNVNNEYKATWEKEYSGEMLDCSHATVMAAKPDKESGELEFKVNFDKKITLVHKTAWVFDVMEAMLPQHENIQLVTRRWNKYTMIKNMMQHVLSELDRIREKIPPPMVGIMYPFVQKAQRVLYLGTWKKAWISLLVHEYIRDCYAALDELERLVDHVNETIQYRVFGPFKEISKVKLCDMPQRQTYKTDVFVQRIEELAAKAAPLIEEKNHLAEEAIVELLDMLLGPTDFTAEDDDEEDVPTATEIREVKGKAAEALSRKEQRTLRIDLEANANFVINRYQQVGINTMMKLTEGTLERIKRRFSIPKEDAPKAHWEVLTVKEPKKKLPPPGPCFAVDMELVYPGFATNPTLEALQLVINTAMQKLLGTFKNVTEWAKYDGSMDKAVAIISARREEAEKERNDDAQTFTTKFAGRPRGGGGPGETSTGGTELSTQAKIKAQKEEEEKRLKEVEEMRELVSNLMKLGDDGTVPGKNKCYFNTICMHQDIMRLITQLAMSIKSLDKPVKVAMAEFYRYKRLWKEDKDTKLKVFLENLTHQNQFEEEIRNYQRAIYEITGLKETCNVGPLAICTNNLKHALVAESRRWIMFFCKHMNEKYRNMMEELVSFMDDCQRKLNREIKDLDDVRLAMATLKRLRENGVRFDHNATPIEDTYTFLNKHGFHPHRDEVERVDSLRYRWERVSNKASDVQVHLASVQPHFRQDLLEKVAAFKIDTVDFFSSYADDGPMVQGLEPIEASDRLVAYQIRFDDLWRKYMAYSDGEELFGLDVNEYPELDAIRKELNLLQKLYGLWNSVNTTFDRYSDIVWTDMDLEKMNNELQEFQNRCRKLPKALKEWPAFHNLKQMIDDMNEICPLLEMLSNKSMQPRHWERISKLTKHNLDVEAPQFMLKSVLDADILVFKEDVEDICIAAVKEKDIEAKLKGVISDWNFRELEFNEFKNRGEMLLKSDHISEAISSLEDSLMVLSSLMSNRYNTHFKKKIQTWVQKLSSTSDIVESWMQVQNLWVYLEAVFVAGDIAKQLPKEAKRFVAIDKSWQKIMQRGHENRNIVRCCTEDETLTQLLPHLLEQLELCQKSLTGYLEKKRLVFPRFFFVSDPVLLEILGQASDSHTIQPHLLSIFDNVKTVTFDKLDYNKILEINSREPETIPLIKPIFAQGNVEVWLNDLLMEAQRSLHEIIRQAYSSLSSKKFSLMDFVWSSPAQVGLLAIQMTWTRDAQRALRMAVDDKEIMNKTNESFQSLLNKLIDTTLQNLTKLERTKFETLITIHVHQRDIFDELVSTDVRSHTDFEWLKQTRFYFKADTNMTEICITDVTFVYQNEFLGCTDRLVITPLTDRCYITLAQALGMALGGAPAGPAGTGKTETTKDMGKALGKYVVVFNCSDQMDYRGLGRIYKGLAQSGSWGCFDEFNRIELPVLSVAAQQIAIILQCKKDRKPTFTFTDGDIVSMNPEFGLFLTMNPGYAGRQELPENLKINFRTVAMMVPDRQIIIRVKLASAGFLENINLSRKFYTLYKLCEEQLSKQVHYDFGLRNILSVLRTLGNVKRQNPNDSESTTVMRVLRDMNLSKLVDEDEPLFLSLIDDLFPGIVLDKAGYPDLEAAIVANVREVGLIAHPPWVLKLIQLFETQRVRHGMMALGPSGAGKTKCIQMLMKAMTDCGQPHREMRMNPKAITAPQMFGRLDVATNDWTDGIFSTLWRRTHKAKKGEHIWIVLDGPVDAIWIENLNSVLDDNKTLTLANGDRISMAPLCKICFEPHNIDNASPATVSRNGMVFMSSSALDWKPILSGWMLTRLDEERTTLMKLFEETFPKVLDFNTTSLIPKMDVLECNYITQAIRLLEGILPKRAIEEDDSGGGGHAEPTADQAVTSNLATISEAGDGAAKNDKPAKETATGKAAKTPSPVPAAGGSEKTEKAAPRLSVTRRSSITRPRGLSDGGAGNARLLSVDAFIVKLPPEVLERYYIFSLMWSVGALLELADRKKLEEFLRAETSLNLPKIHPGSGDTIFEYVVNEDTGEWQHWKDRIEEYTYPVDHVPEYASILVPNVDNVRADYLINAIASQNLGVLLIGEQGTAKTVITKGYMNKYNPEKHLGKSFNFSSASTPYMFQRTIESYVEKRMGMTFGPPAGRKMTVFIDDINMPIINEWGDQVTNEIVRQTIEMQGFYSLEKPGDFTSIVDIQFLAAMIHPGGGRNDIPSRLKRQFAILNCTLPSENSIDKIFGVIAKGYFCAEREFTPEVVSLIGDLVQVTRLLWQSTKVKMLPTPAKFHYIFNLRDLSRIWEGMLKVSGETITTANDVIGLWKHECQRVIADRFTEKADRDWFDQCMKQTCSRKMSPELASQLPDEPYFVDFMRDAPELTGDEPDDQDMEAPKIYERVMTLDELEQRLSSLQAQYNESIRGVGMDLVFFKDAMTHLIKISRVIRTSRGHCLLVGVGGSGKQSLTRLASYIAGYKTFQITLSRSYNVTNLQEDLRFLYRTAGHQGKGITFIFTDQDVKEEAFLEYLNNILASGEVANLFPRDEHDEIMNDIISPMKKEFPRRPPTQENLHEYFLYRCRLNLHVVLCFSPVGEKFRNRALKFPALISGCTMDWFSRWPKEALQAVARHFLASYDIVCTAAVKQHVVFAMGMFQDRVAEASVDYFHRFRRTTHVTPVSYLSFINSYKSVYTEKHSAIGLLAERMQTGLDKLTEAGHSVAKLSKELVVKEKELAIASTKAEKVLSEVTESAQAAEKVKAEVQVVKDKAEAIVVAIGADRKVAQVKLDEAKPALEEAAAALLTIKPADIATVRKLSKPPHLIMRIMDCCLVLMQRKISPFRKDPDHETCKPSWTDSMKLMSGGGFLQALQNFPKDLINDEIVELLQPYFEAEDYNALTAKKVCGNVAGLCSWTKAMAKFYATNKEILPLKANLLKQEALLNVAQKELDEAQAQLDEKEAQLKEQQMKYENAMAEKQALIDDAELCRRKMGSATALIEGLSGEKERWTQQSKEFDEQIQRLVGDVLLCTAFLSYAGPFNQEFRDVLVKDWKKEIKHRGIPLTSTIEIIDELVDSTTIGEWGLQGLPNDELSIQNGIIVTTAARYPLLIDPQGQGKRWVKNREAKNRLRVTALNSKYFRTHLEDSLSLGNPLLIEDIGEELDPALDNVLEKNFIKSGKSLKVKVGDKEVDVMKGFMLYITTKLPNPSYTPEISAKTSIIDFTVTMKGLGDQLLGLVILKEKQELEQERVDLLEDVTSNKRKMKELEDNVLYRLTSTQGSLVDDETLIDVLRTTKLTAQDVQEKLVVAAATQVKITSAREEFRPVATRGSILYFLITNMSMVNCMYQTSLPQFLGLFDKSMERSEKSYFADARIDNIVNYLTLEVFRYTMRGLYEQDKFLFTLLLTLKIDIDLRKIKHEELMVLIKGGAALDINSIPKNKPTWMLDGTWLNLVALENLERFRGITETVLKKPKLWKTWFDKPAPEEAKVPSDYSTPHDSMFSLLLLVRSWCPDRITAQAMKYIAESLGEDFSEGYILDIEEMLNESTPHTPLICLLSMGSDPTSNIEGLAKRKRLECHAISMGQGQDVHARRLLEQDMRNGAWALLQNCHLGLDFMDELFTMVSEAEKVNPDFRLWITTEVHPKFPISLLQIGIKYTNEPPHGIKPGLKRTYRGITQEHLEINGMPQWRPMLFALAFLHTIVQERRKFGPLGWNIPYEFNQSDFTSTMQFFQNHLDDMDLKKGVSWITIQYMIGEVQYGGRVTDDFDKILLNTYARTYFNACMFAYGNYIGMPGYTIPVDITGDKFRIWQDFMDHIDQLPANDTPEVFGLHVNADIAYQTNTAQTCMNIILSIQPKDSGGSGGATRESVVFKQAEDMLKRLPAAYVPHEVKARLHAMGHLQPMNIFLRQEIDRMQRVISAVRSTLLDLKLAIDGTIIMNENLRDALDNMYDARIPTLWKKISWQSSTLGFWFTELLERDAQFRAWCFKGRPKVFWMTGFFNPQGFLTAMRQEVTRAHTGWALDSVILDNTVTSMNKTDVRSPPEEGVYVHGLFLDGAAWDKEESCLVESPQKVLFSPLPVVHIFAINTSPPPATASTKDKKKEKVDKAKTGTSSAPNTAASTPTHSAKPPPAAASTISRKKPERKKDESQKPEAKFDPKKGGKYPKPDAATRRRLIETGAMNRARPADEPPRKQDRLDTDLRSVHWIKPPPPPGKPPAVTGKVKYAALERRRVRQVIPAQAAAPPPKKPSWPQRQGQPAPGAAKEATGQDAKKQQDPSAKAKSTSSKKSKFSPRTRDKTPANADPPPDVPAVVQVPSTHDAGLLAQAGMAGTDMSLKAKRTGPFQPYSCPVYKKPQRTDLTYITTLKLNTPGQSADHWTLRGVALLCDIK
ncbi:dynein axonemal heavy chain 5-like [Sycon ciliatum]